MLNDSSITQLKWQEVEIGMAIGKGASGLVSEGTWKPTYVIFWDHTFWICLTRWCRGGSARPIALKELIIGFDEISDDALHEFLAEIKYMR